MVRQYLHGKIPVLIYIFGTFQGFTHTFGLGKGYARISGGIFSCSSGYAIAAGIGEYNVIVDIYDGTFSTSRSEFYDLYCHTGSTMNVYGGTFTTSSGITDLRE